MLAALTENLRILEAHELLPGEALPRITLTLSADTDFMTIAKIRSAATFHMIAKNIGCAHVAPTIHCETSQRAYSRLDSWVNILRPLPRWPPALREPSLSASPRSAISDSDNMLTRRIARNTQIILQEESHIGHVSDAAGGSWYVETLTQQLTEQAWALTIEAAGGLTEQMNDGSACAQLDARCRDYEALVETRDLPLVGVSEFPNSTKHPCRAPPLPKAAIAMPKSLGLARSRRARETESFWVLGTAATFTPRANFAANTYATVVCTPLPAQAPRYCRHCTRICR